MTKRKKPKAKLLRGCPRCGGAWGKVAGLIRCLSCGHESGSQNPALTWGGRIEVQREDDQPVTFRDPGKRSATLEFHEPNRWHRPRKRGDRWGEL